jgi:hypothetical protein
MNWHEIYQKGEILSCGGEKLWLKENQIILFLVQMQQVHKVKEPDTMKNSLMNH